MAKKTIQIWFCDCCGQEGEKYSLVGYHFFWFQKLEVCKPCYEAVRAAIDSRKALKEAPTQTITAKETTR